MKTPKNLTKAIHASPPVRARRGFALVVTLTLMVLLSILALGMLSLSTISLRTASNSDSNAVARANALLALKIAIGDLQAAAGPDQRITAPGGVTDPDAGQRMITGVWKSRKLGPTSSATDFSETTKDQEFVKWLVSAPDKTTLEKTSYAISPLVPGVDAVELVSEKKPHTSSPPDANDPVVEPVVAAKVTVKNSTAAGAPASGKYAYAVLDEGIKARVNSGVKAPRTDLASRSIALGGGQRPAVVVIDGAGQLAESEVDLSLAEGRALLAKMVSIPSAEFAYGRSGGVLENKFHDLTTSSSGVLADVANGGLKKDLNLLAEAKTKGTLPADYQDKGIYELAFGAGIASDPRWSRALGWAGVFNSPSLSKKSVGGVSVPTISASSPPGWVAGTGRLSGGSGTNPATAQLSNTEPPGRVLLPAVAKIQMSFSLAARDVYKYASNLSEPPKAADGSNPGMHGPWDSKFQEDLTDSKKKFDSPYDYLLHMVYSPIITLHNPYNVPITFEKLRVDFVDLPFAFQVFKNGLAQTKYPVPFSLMYGSSTAGGKSKRFGLTLTDTMLPGEVKIYSPKIDPSRTWEHERRAGDDKVFWDWGNANLEDGRTGGTNTDTSRAVGIPGWNGAKVGYDLDFLCPGGAQAYEREKVGTKEIDRWDGIPLKKDDEIYVLSTPLPDTVLPEKRFSVEMTVNFEDKKLTRSSVLVFEYEDKDDIADVLLKDHPQASGNTIRWPKGTDTFTTMQLFDHSETSLANIKNTRPFALFSAYAKSTAGGKSTPVEDGLWAAKPFAFQNHTSVAISQNIKKGHPSHYSHELAISRFPDQGIGIQGGSNRGRFLSGQSHDRGRHFGTLYEIPLAPLQSLSGLNSAQLAASTKLPHFSAPVGNSYAHPLITASEVTEDGSAEYKYADHSFLLNAALYDSYYNSGMQTTASAATGGSARSAETVIDEFLGFDSLALPDSRLKPYFPDGETKAIASGKLKGADGYLEAAAHQLVEGAFNVNSLSVDAWKAVLASMSGKDAMALVNPTTESAASTLTESNLDTNSDPKGARFSRFRIPNGQPNRTDSNGFWRGSIDLTEAQLSALAGEIVNQIRARGPFLSMAEFINRQIGPADAKTQAGALQAAIDTSEMNKGVSVGAAAGIEITDGETDGLGFKNPDALLGDSAQGAPGYLMQADVLAILGNAATVRSDTFRIRAYGEALDNNGKVTARAWCEAIVQRTPEYVDSQDSAGTRPENLVGAANRIFGRRFALVSMRWLSPGEI